jgi:hypothetical protein
MPRSFRSTMRERHDSAVRLMDPARAAPTGQPLLRVCLPQPRSYAWAIDAFTVMPSITGITTPALSTCS